MERVLNLNQQAVNGTYNSHTTIVQWTHLTAYVGSISCSVLNQTGLLVTVLPVQPALHLLAL